MLICSVYAGAAPPSGLPVADPQSVGVDPARLTQITALLQQHVDDGLIAGAVAGVARHGNVVYLESIGWQDAEQQQSMQDGSIFQIRSMSKPVTAVAALQLIEQGRLSLDDPVSRYLPRYGYMFVFINPDQPFLSAERKPDREMTIRDLLLNTAGLSHRNSVLYRQRGVRSRADSLEQLVDKVAGVPLIGDPGEQWVYSISLTVLGRVVEIVSGQALDDYLQEHVFGPLEMADSGFYVPEDKVARLARPYQVPEGDQPLTRIGEMEIPITQDPPLLEGAAGMVSSVPDYLRFLQALLNQGELDGRRVLQAATVQEMTRNQVDQALFPFGSNPAQPMLDRGWGYGLAVVVDASQSEIGVNNGEFGWNGSLGTFSWADPQTGTVAILMMQVQPSRAHDLSGRFKNLVYDSVDANQ
jgi:CubicO group peptidase (beta-lactamase class C family)